MAENRRIVRVFLASPGDLQQERQLTKKIVDEINNLWGEQTGYFVELVGWEDTVSAFGRPQELINRDLEGCEFFIGLMWKRWGTPPAAEGPYTSGFEEEFERSAKSHQDTGHRPEISLFFKEVDAAQLADPGDELKKVLNFKKKIQSERLVYYEEFNEADFEDKIRRCITRHLQTLIKEGVASQTPESGSRTVPEASEKLPAETILSAEGTRFVQELVSTLADTETVDALAVAQLRLIAATIERPGNDEQTLGVHDANLLFKNREALVLGQREVEGLIDSGLEHHNSENVPLWYWHARRNGFEWSLLPVRSIIGGTEIRVGALLAMRLVDEQLAGPPPFTREHYLFSWLEETTPWNVKVAALGYLGECGTPADLPAMRAELDRGNYQTIGPATDATLRINLRDSRDKAIKTLLELQPEALDPRLVKRLFDKPESIPSALLLECVAHRNSLVRRMSARLLRERHELDSKTAEQLQTDSDARVRLEALLSLAADGGKAFSDEEAKRILVKPTRGPFGLLNPLAPDAVGQECLELYRLHRLSTMAVSELENVASGETILDRTAQFILIEKRFSSLGNQLRSSTKDQFKTEFKTAVEQMGQRLGAESEIVQKMNAVEGVVRKGLTRKGLEVICRNGDSRDLNLVRSVLRTEFVGYSQSYIQYLRAHGEWEDIPLIVGALERGDRDLFSLLSSPDEGRYQVAARVLHHIGRSRFPELLALPMPHLLLEYLIALAPDTKFAALTDDSIMRLFQSEHDSVRKVAALKCIRSLSKARLKRLLKRYLLEDTFYYNVIYWLDFGISVSKERSASAARKTLSQKWPV